MGDSRSQQGFNLNDYSQAHIQKLTQNFINSKEELPRRSRSETKLLRAVANEVEERLEQSLHNRVYVELDKEEDPHQVVPWSVDVKVGELPQRRCPEGTKIIEIFDRPEIDGRLLILGAPGSGKTILLLQLARVLVQRVIANEDQPVPVLLNLSSWKEKNKTIREWMVSTLKWKYRVRKDVGEGWIKDGRVFPLLDGLDEVVPEEQDTCVQALNPFLLDLPAVVCSQVAQHEIGKFELNLNGSVVLQPLSDSQVEKFLGRAGKHWLWDVIKGDRNMMHPEMGLARSPLWLTILALTINDPHRQISRFLQQPRDQKQTLIRHFIEQRLAKNGDQSTKAVRWLGTLASQLIKSNKSEFYIGDLSFFSLDSGTHKILHVLLIGVLCGMVATTSVGIFQVVATQDLAGMVRFWTSESGLMIGAVGFGAGLILGTIEGEADTNLDTIDIHKRYTVIQIIKEIFNGIGGGLLLTTLGVLQEFLIARNINYGFLVLGIYLGLSMAIAGLLDTTEVDSRQQDNQDIQSYISNFCILLPVTTVQVILTVGGLNIVSAFSDVAPNPNLPVSSLIAIGLFFGLARSLFMSGVHNIILNVAFRITFYLFGDGPWNYQKFLRHCTRSGFLVRANGGYQFAHPVLKDYLAEGY